MKTTIIIIPLLISSFGKAQNLPLDFESTALEYQFVDFDGGSSAKISNPQQAGINTSATVMKLVKGIGEVWAGSKIIMPKPIDVTTDRIIKLKVFSPVAGIRLLLKFEGEGSFFEKQSSPIQKANVWEELTFDFSAEVTNNLNNQMVFIFNFGEIGYGDAKSTFLIDDVVQLTGNQPILPLPNLPLNFESAAIAYPFLDFDGGEVTVITNPYPKGINASTKVGRMIKNRGEDYAGSVIQMADLIDFSKNKIIKMKVWSPAAGKKTVLKFEGDPNDFENIAFETEAITTKTNEWEELIFDFSAPNLYPPVHNKSTKIVFFFDFGSQGDGSVNSTYYFDDVSFLKG